MNLRPLAVAALLAAFVAHADSDRFSVRGDEPIGSYIKARGAWTEGKIPLNKRYEELTAEQKRDLADNYESMGEGDEPPFPLEGLGPIVKALIKLQGKFRVTGELSLAADIDASGNATSVNVFVSPDPEITRYTASVIVLTKFKPALCKGVPCKMQYPFLFLFTMR